MRGKYSPTVSAAYMADQDWWKKYTGEDEFTYHQYDPEGYDSYGYNSQDLDRAGNYEHEYYSDDVYDGNFKYNVALDEWGFDGVKPMTRYELVEVEQREVADEVFIGKVIRDGKVAVLFSPGFGAGWSTWNGAYADDILFDPVIVGYVENEKWPELTTYVAMRYPDVYTGGLNDLTIKWIPQGSLFKVEEYDGSESITINDSAEWFVA
jgi:hypothetical protein